MRSTSKAWVVSSESHFNHIEQAFIDNNAFFDQALGGFLDRHADRGVVIRCANYEVHLSQDAAFIRFIMVG